MAKYETGLALQDITSLQSTAFHVMEYQDRGFVVLRIHPDTAGAKEALAQLGITLPSALQMTGSFEDKLVKWISPDEYLVTLPLANKTAFIQQAQNAFAPIFAAVVDNSGAYSLLRISGEQRYEVLSKLCLYDLRNGLPIGKVVSTLLAKSPALFYRLDNESLYWMVRFSFADYAWQALQAASKEFSEGLTTNTK